jgi:hypothetical protein
MSRQPVITTLRLTLSQFPMRSLLALLFAALFAGLSAAQNILVFNSPSDGQDVNGGSSIIVSVGGVSPGTPLTLQVVFGNTLLASYSIASGAPTEIPIPRCYVGTMSLIAFNNSLGLSTFVTIDVLQQTRFFNPAIDCCNRLRRFSEEPSNIQDFVAEESSSTIQEFAAQAPIVADA